LKALNGFLDRFHENLRLTDRMIADARKSSENKKLDSRARIQYLKILGAAVEERERILLDIKAHLLGRGESGVVREPSEVWDYNSEVEFERCFQNMLSPWTHEDLKLKCEDCGVWNENVTHRRFHHPYPEEDENYDLCPKCYDKKMNESSVENEDTAVAKAATKGDLRTIVQGARLTIKLLRTLPVDERITKLTELLADTPSVAPGMEATYETYRTMLQKELDKAKRTKDDKQLANGSGEVPKV